MRGSDVNSGKGLHIQKKEKRETSRVIEKEIIAMAHNSTLSEIAKQHEISETAAAKILARVLKKEPSLTADMLIEPANVREIETLLLRCNTSSISRITKAADGRFTEAEIRIVKAQIEKNGVENWDC